MAARSAILAETDAINIYNSDDDPYDQYEFSVRLEEAGDCMQKARMRMHAPCVQDSEAGGCREVPACAVGAWVHARYGPIGMILECMRTASLALACCHLVSSLFCT